MVCTINCYINLEKEALPLWHNGISDISAAGSHVQSLAWYSELRIWHCHNYSIGHKCGSDLIPGRGTPYVMKQLKKKKKKFQRFILQNHYCLLEQLSTKCLGMVPNCRGQEGKLEDEKLLMPGNRGCYLLHQFLLMMS